MPSINHYKIAGWVGLAMLLVSLVLSQWFPLTAGELPPGFKQPIIAFEFAQTQQEIEALFGPAGSLERQQWINGMNWGNYGDYLFMVLYSLVIALILRGIALDPRNADRTRALRPLSISLPLWILLSDALENLLLLDITDALAMNESYRLALRFLPWVTWMKWGGLVVVFALIGVLAPFAHPLARLLRGLLLLPAVTALWALLERGAAMEWMVLTITLGFVALWLFALFPRLRV